MPYDVSGFEFIALDRLTETDQRLPFDPHMMDSLERKGLVARRVGLNKWTLTGEGRSLVADVMSCRTR